MEKLVLEYFKDKPKSLRLTTGEIYHRLRHPNGRKALFRLLDKMARRGLIRKSNTWYGLVQFSPK